MRTSARNVLRGTVISVDDGAVNAEVSIAVSGDTTLTAIVTRDSVREMELGPGRAVAALIKASFIILAPADEARRTTVRNRIEGTVVRREDGAVNTEIGIDVGDGRGLTAIVTLHSADALDLRVGGRVCALIDAGHIILAVD